MQPREDKQEYLEIKKKSGGEEIGFYFQSLHSIQSACTPSLEAQTGRAESSSRDPNRVQHGNS